MKTTTEMTVPNPNIEDVKQRVLTVRDIANTFIIKNQEDLNASADILHEIKQVKTLLIERKEAITRPIMTSLASVRDLFKPLEEHYQLAEKVIKTKILDYQNVHSEKIENEKNRLLDRLSRGTIKQETAIAKFEALDAQPKNATGVIAKISTRTVPKVKIVDATLIPREYLVPDVAKITEAVLRLKQTIPGVERYEEKIIASRSNY